MDWLALFALLALIGVIGTLLHSGYKWIKENW